MPPKPTKAATKTTTTTTAVKSAKKIAPQEVSYEEPAPKPTKKATTAKKTAAVVETMNDEPSPKQTKTSTKTASAAVIEPVTTTKSTITKKTAAAAPAAAPTTGGGYVQALQGPAVTKAVKALRAFLTGGTGASKKLIDSEGGYFELQINLKKAQTVSKSISLPLTNSIYKRPGVSICLLTKDPQDEWEEFLAANPVNNVTKIISVKKLATDFKPFEHRRLLSKQHDLFLADQSIVPMLMQLLGKTFFGTSKQPIGVNLQRKFKIQLQKARDSTHFRIPQGQTFQIRVGHADLSNEEIIQNVTNLMPQLAKVLPKGVASILLKTEFSASLPLYVNLATKEDFVATVEETKEKMLKTIHVRNLIQTQQAKKYKLSVELFQKVKSAAIHCQMPIAKYLKIAKQRGIKLGEEVQLPEPKASIKAAVDEAKKKAVVKAAVDEDVDVVAAPVATKAKKAAAKKDTKMDDEEVETKKAAKGPTKRKTAPKPDVADVETPAAKPVKKARK
jgi:hypothetical protein